MKASSFSLVVLAWLLNFIPASAFPTLVRRSLQSNSGITTLPLRRLHIPRADLHPQVHLQQLINRGSKRLARMTGRNEPSEETLRSELHKRLYLVESGPGSRFGIAAEVEESDFSNRHHKSSQAAAGAQDNCTIAVGDGNSTTGTGNPENNSTSAGVSPLDIKAATNGGVTYAKPPTASDTLGLDIDANDLAYLSVIQIGTPPQNFLLLMDSGSADFWVAGENCQTCGNHTTLGPQSSSSFALSNQKFSVTYGSGAVQGLLCQDDVNIAGLVLKDHTFGVATAESTQFATDNIPFDGIMGLAQSKLSQEKVPTPVESLAENKLIEAPITSFKIPRLSDQLNDGQVTFGGLDPTKFIADTLVTIPNVNTQGFWEGEIDAITVDDVNIMGLAGRTAILDTGTTLILAPPLDAALVIESLGGTCDTQQCTIPCTTQASLAFSFGNTSFAIDPRDLAVVPLDLNDPTGTCTAGIQPQQIGTDTEWLVGDVFLKNAYFSTNVATNEISLAQLTKP